MQRNNQNSETESDMLVLVYSLLLLADDDLEDDDLEADERNGLFPIQMMTWTWLFDLNPSIERRVRYRDLI